jgi:Tfp pilus assembly protein PilV
VNKRHEASGFTTIEIVIVLSLFGFVLIGLVGLHLLAVSAGAAAESSSVAANLARGRMEELLAVPRNALPAQNGAEERRQVPPGKGRSYVVRSTVVATDPARLDLKVTVSWQQAYGSTCGEASGRDCTGSQAAYSRTLETRVQEPDDTPPTP